MGSKSWVRGLPPVATGARVWNILAAPSAWTSVSTGPAVPSCNIPARRLTRRNLSSRSGKHQIHTPVRGETLELEAGHRRHAEIENAIRDLKYGVGLNHLPSGRFAANAAWLAVQAMAHNLACWTARIGLGDAGAA